MDWRDHIVSDPRILVGKPTFRGTRLSVEMVLQRLAAGWSEDLLFQSYPRLTPEMLRAAFAFAAEATADHGSFPQAA